MSLAYCVGKKCLNLGKVDMNLEGSGASEFISFLLHLFASVTAAYIAWNRSAGSGVAMQVIMALLAFMFGVLYLIYLVGVVMMGDPLFKKTYMVNMPQEQLDDLANKIAGGV